MVTSAPEMAAPPACAVTLPVTVPVVGAGADVPMNRSRFGLPAPAFDTALTVAAPISALATVAGVAAGFVARYSAAAPATCGVAIEVPLRMLVAVLLVFQSEVMLEPGAKMSTQVP